MARRRGYTEPSKPSPPEESLPKSGLEAALLKWAGERSFRAGRQYLRDGAVRDWEQNGRELTGLVMGSETYEVELLLRIDGNDIDEYVCDCPYHEDHGAFCKHCVALGLAFAASAAARSPDSIKPVSTKDALRDYLNTLEKPALIALLQRLAQEDRGIREKLNLEAASAGPRETQAVVLRKALENKTYIRGFLDYYETRNWVRGVETVLTQIQALLPRDPALVLELSAFAIERIDQAVQEADDSNGEIGDLLAGVQELHLKACQAAPPDPIVLAHTLWDWERKSDFIYATLRTYHDILGQPGRAEYRRLLEEEWETLPELKPGMHEYSSHRFRVTSGLEAFAEAEGDIDALIAIRRKNLSEPHHFLKIAQTLLDARRRDEALEWAERGWQAFSSPDQRLAEFLIQRYQTQKRYNDAIGIVWRVFENHPTAENAVWIKKTARHTDRWPELRGRVIDLLSTRPSYRANELIKFLLAEDDPDTAWNEAQARSCSAEVLLKLADIRVRTHPQDAIATWKRVSESWIEGATGSYNEPVALLEKLASHLSEADFVSYITLLRDRFKRKRNFLKELDQRGL